MFNNSMSPADLGAIMGNNNDGFGGNGAWWLLIILFFLGGFGGNGWGNNSGAYDNYVLNSDFATLQRQLDSATDRLAQQGNSIANGLCDGFYTQAQLVNGIDKSIAGSTYALQNAITQDTISAMQNTNAIQTQIANCCCENRYDALANANATQNAINTGFCQTNFNAQSNTRDIVDSQNASTQAILAKLNAMESNAKDERIAQLQADNQRLSFCASQQAQNSYLLGKLQPTPVPSYPVSYPYTYGYGTTIS